ncbi:orotidine-5'-phosphate decarboxylase [uncultured Desulfobulbus sp.]|uniref:orotidine-5'-phosphate decarboxylase n=1 Tax=uncultured Desulfobulbus sp. TaxID=239745 RepID=UPI0029C961D7|nr:orotidine-5'-phosphate decarboxylase [uncultured Desulfobulbus sp.]
MNKASIPLDERIIFALDLADPREALALVDRLAGQIRFFKVGLQLFFAGGWPVVDYIVAKNCKVMLDLKLYDIPATVQLAVHQFADRGISFTTVHGYGPVVEAALAAETGIQILAVTVLTSFGAEQVSELQYPGSVDDLVLQRAQTVLKLGCHGVVCSAREATLLRQRLGQDFIMVTPGIRPSGADLNDQQRVATPGRAIADGADYLVIGRPIRDAADPDACIAAIQREIATALE